MSVSNRRITIVGAGLAGSLLGVRLARQGIETEILERWPDPRKSRIPAGRSINLALAERGREALRSAGVLETVERFALPMRGRMLHNEAGETTFQAYGQRENEIIWSVHRARLNEALLDAAEAHGVPIHFDRRLEQADFDACRLELVDSQGRHYQHDFELAVGADGAGSALRQAMAGETELGAREEPLGHGYLELTIPPDEQGRFRMEPEALHIWPRGGFMMIALPNPDASFTCTLFLDNDGDPGFEQLAEVGAMRQFLRDHFPDAVANMPDLETEIASNPVGYLATLYVDLWHLDDRAVLLGDAAHAIVPFHGQGMNAAFEDTVAFEKALLEAPDPGAALERFFRERKPNGDAIAAMALDNYLEMRDRVREPRFHLKKQLEWALEKRLPEQFIPRYAMVMFHPEISYAEANARGNAQDRLLESIIGEHTTLDQIDLDHATREAEAKLADQPNH